MMSFGKGGLMFNYKDSTWSKIPLNLMLESELGPIIYNKYILTVTFLCRSLCVMP